MTFVFITHPRNVLAQRPPPDSSLHDEFAASSESPGEHTRTHASRSFRNNGLCGGQCELADYRSAIASDAAIILDDRALARLVRFAIFAIHRPDRPEYRAKSPGELRTFERFTATEETRWRRLRLRHLCARARNIDSIRQIQIYPFPLRSQLVSYCKLLRGNFVSSR